MSTLVISTMHFSRKIIIIKILMLLYHISKKFTVVKHSSNLCALAPFIQDRNGLGLHGVGFGCVELYCERRGGGGMEQLYSLLAYGLCCHGTVHYCPPGLQQLELKHLLKLC